MHFSLMLIKITLNNAPQLFMKLLPIVVILLGMKNSVKDLQLVKQLLPSSVMLVDNEIFNSEVHVLKHKSYKLVNELDKLIIDILHSMSLMSV